MGETVPPEVNQAARNLRFNSIAICCVRVARDHLGDNLAVTLADKQVVFHRLTKLNYFYPDVPHDGTSTLMLEVTYRPGDPTSKLSDEELLDRVVEGLARVRFIDRREDVLERTILRVEHAYVIYDLDHRRNTSLIRDYCRSQPGLWLHGRFGEFNYLNIDAVLRCSRNKDAEMRERW
jgi:protoporphyrinogen oxidase